jgi:hypothetical protein
MGFVNLLKTVIFDNYVRKKKFNIIKKTKKKHKQSIYFFLLMFSPNLIYSLVICSFCIYYDYDDIFFFQLYCKCQIIKKNETKVYFFSRYIMVF